MILLSLNIRGVGGPLKFPSMRRLIDTTKPDLIFLQETLVDEEKARKFMFSLCPLGCTVQLVQLENREDYWWLGILI
jgi:exonuclease III